MRIRQFLLLSFVLSSQLLLADTNPIRVEQLSSHTLVDIVEDEPLVALEDGSHWVVADPEIVATWRSGDAIQLIPDSSWFGSYEYYLVNKNTRTSVQANLHAGPQSFGPLSHWIVEIDHHGGHVYLQNGMIWCVKPQDQHLLKFWAAQDHIIVGHENSLWSYYDTILINATMDEYIRVKQY